MSALARWFFHQGYAVAGYDRTPSPLTAALQAEGIPVHFEDDERLIPSKFLEDHSQLLVVWTPAVPKETALYQFFEAEAITIKKRSEVLGMLTSHHYTIAVAGTHGKTTTSSLLAHLMRSAGKPVTAFLGGITQNYESNLLINTSKEEDLIIVEADEFDRSFLHLRPNAIILTSADPDHLDIYGDEASILDGFRDFIKLLKKKGKLYIQDRASSRIGEDHLPKKRIKQYGLRNATGIMAENIRARSGSFVFDYKGGKAHFQELELMIPGFHNVENALSAIAVALDHGLNENQIREGLTSFRGVKRRFEIHLNTAEKVFIDDYAHHPEEIRACLSSVRAMFPGRKLTVVFQPHLFSRTRDFATGFSESLSLADEVLLLDIYPAREVAIPGVEASMLLGDIQSDRKELVGKDQLLEKLNGWKPEVLVTLGAGDIDRLVPEITKWMYQNDNPDKS